MHAWGQAAVLSQCSETEIKSVGMNDRVMLQAALMYVRDEAKLCGLDQGSTQNDCTAGGPVHFSSY